MSIFNGNQRFAEKKATTKPFVKTPKTIREILNITTYHEKGEFQIEPGKGFILYDRCYVFEDINYIKKDLAKKEDILHKLMIWLNSMNTDFKIVLANEYRDMDRYIEGLLNDQNQAQYPTIAKGMERLITDKIEDGEINVSKVRYLVVTCRAKSPQEARMYFEALDTGLYNNFALWGSHIYRLSALERMCTLRAFFRGEENDVQSMKPYLETTDWKDGVLPAGIEVHKNFMIIDGTYVSVLYGREFANSLNEEKLMHGFSNTSYPNYVTLDFAPIDRTRLKDKLAAAHVDNEKAIEQELQAKIKAGAKNPTISYRKKKRSEELEDYRTQVDDNNEKAFYLGLLIVVTASSADELTMRTKSLKMVGRENGVRLDFYNWQQLRALNTALPYGGRQVNHMRSCLTSSVVAFQPYYAQDVQEYGGMMHGLNRTTKRMILVDRKKLKNPHGMIVGHSGGGKSMLIKMTELSQTLLATDDDIFIIDPQNEFEGACQQFGGVFFDFTPKGQLHLNALEVPQEVFFSDDRTKDRFIAEQAEYMKSFCVAAMRKIRVTQEHLTVVATVIEELYREAFSQKNLAEQPTLKHLHKIIRQKLQMADNTEDQRTIRSIYNSLKEYTRGSYDMFSYESNIEIHNRLVAFGLTNVPENMWEAAMITIMAFLNNRIRYNQKIKRATHFIVDEAQVVCENQTSAEMLLKTVVTFRKFGGIVTMALQNLKRAIENPSLRDMLSNCEYKCFLDQGGVDAQALCQIQEFSESEIRALSEEKPGHGVMVWGQKVLLFDLYLDRSNPLYDTFNTNFHEKAKEKVII